MAHFTRVRLSGFWTTNSTLLNTEMEAFDDRVSKAVNGDEGGTWAPSSPIEFGGQGLKTSGPFLSTGTFNVSAMANLNGGATITGGDLAVALNATVQGDLEAQGTSHFIGAVTADGDVACERLAIHGAHLGSNILSVSGAARVTGDVEINGLFACDGAGSFGSTLAIAGTATFNGAVSLTQPLTPSGSGRVRRKVLAGPDATTTLNASTAEQVIILALTADRTYTLTTTGASDGDVVRVSSRWGGHTVSLVAQGANPVTYPLKLNGAGLFDWVELTYLSGGWYLTGYFKNLPSRATHDVERGVLW